MSLPAQRLKQLRAILLKSKKDMNRTVHPGSPFMAGKGVLSSWTTARQSLARRIRTMRRTGRPDVELWPFLHPSERGSAIPSVKHYVIRQLPLKKEEKSRWKVLEFIRQHVSRKAGRKIYRDLKKGRLGNA